MLQPVAICVEVEINLMVSRVWNECVMMDKDEQTKPSDRSNKAHRTPIPLHTMENAARAVRGRRHPLYFAVHSEHADKWVWQHFWDALDFFLWKLVMRLVLKGG